jgi:hypothetical protein
MAEIAWGKRRKTLGAHRGKFWDQGQKGIYSAVYKVLDVVVAL